MAYSEKVMDHFNHPRNVGEMENPSGVGTVGNAKCGDIMRMYLDIDDNGIIQEAKFKTFGCGAAVATSSGGISRRLYDGAVAAGDRAHQRRQAELNGIIPRRDDQRDAIRLRRDKAFRVELRQRRRDGALTHPALQVLQMEAHLLEHHARFAHINLHRSLAEVLIHGLLQQLLVCLQRAL